MTKNQLIRRDKKYNNILCAYFLVNKVTFKDISLFLTRVGKVDELCRSHSSHVARIPMELIGKPKEE